MTGEHIGEELLGRFLRAEATREEARQVVRHLLSRCSECLALSSRVAAELGLSSQTASWEEAYEEIFARTLAFATQEEERLAVEKLRGWAGGLVFLEGEYEEYLRNPQRVAKVKANEISYAWDALIERFNFHAMQGTQFFPTPGGISTTERIMRWMAREPRTRRRMLARKLVDCVVTTPKHLRRTAVMKPSSPGDPCYVFLMIPWDDKRSEQDNRELRGKLLQAACMVVRLNWPDALDVVGIASESGNETPNRSEDAMYCDFREWTDDMAEQAREWQKLLNMLVNPKLIYGTEHEYPETLPSSCLMRVGRNDLCPCGSGKKYKKCHGMSLAQRQSSESR